MKQFYFKINFDIFQESFRDGQLNQVNHFNQNELAQANNLDDAINKLFKNRLYFDYNKDLVFYDSNNKNIFNYNVLVDCDNCEVKEDQQIFKDWQQNKAILYSCDMQIEVYELQEINLNEIFKNQ